MLMNATHKRQCRNRCVPRAFTAIKALAKTAPARRADCTPSIS